MGPTKRISTNSTKTYREGGAAVWQTLNSISYLKGRGPTIIRSPPEAVYAELPQRQFPELVGVKGLTARVWIVSPTTGGYDNRRRDTSARESSPVKRSPDGQRVGITCGGREWLANSVTSKKAEKILHDVVVSVVSLCFGADTQAGLYNELQVKMAT